jgi:hypothetical protein
MPVFMRLLARVVILLVTQKWLISLKYLPPVLAIIYCNCFLGDEKNKFIIAIKNQQP